MGHTHNFISGEVGEREKRVFQVKSFGMFVHLFMVLLYCSSTVLHISISVSGFKHLTRICNSRSNKNRYKDKMSWGIWSIGTHVIVYNTWERMHERYSHDMPLLV